jgi:hypothetical protein
MLVILGHALEKDHGFGRVAKSEQTGIVIKESTWSRVLNDRRPARGEKAEGPVTDPRIDSNRSLTAAIAGLGLVPVMAAFLPRESVTLNITSLP